LSWHGRLQLNYRRDGPRCIAGSSHLGPLRVLKALYPEGEHICHQVLVHPPGGIVGGDVLEVDIVLEPQCHAVITTPGATRFYRSQATLATQQIDARIAGDARLEWLPLETIAHRGCAATNRQRFELEPGAEMMGWDVLALGLPAAGEHFDSGRFLQHLEIPERWLERAAIRGDDARLLDSPLGLAGRRVLATLWFAAGHDLAAARRDALLDAARRCAADSELAAQAGATSPQARVVVLRALADRVEPAMALLGHVRATWRQAAWALSAEPPRIWRT